MRVLVIGGTRFIGPRVTGRLISAGHEVTVFHRGETETEPAPGIVHIHGDRSALRDHRADFARFRPDVVLDMAADSGHDAIAVVDAVRGIAQRLVAVSSIDVYRAYGRLHGSEPGPIEPMPLTEDSPLREKLYPYRGERAGKLDGYDKIPAEDAVMSDAQLVGTVVRLPAVHGEGDYQHRLFMELSRMDASRPAILVQADQMQWRWPRSYAGNCADAIALAVTDVRAAGRIYHVAEPETMTQEDWLRTVGRLAGWSGEIIALPKERMPDHLQSSNNFAQDLVVDTSRVRGELGYAESVSAEAGIARAIAWERTHPPERVNPKWLDFAAEDDVLARQSSR